MFKFKLSYFSLLLLLMCSCAKAPVSTLQNINSESWQKYQKLCSSYQVSPSRYQMSLRIGSEGDTRRVTGVLWGNNASDIRLEISAGIGVTIAQVAETESSFILYSPYDKKVYEHLGTQKPFFKVGRPLPLRLSYIFSLLSSDFAALFGEHCSLVERDPNGHVRYTVQDGPLFGTLELAESGHPIIWRENSNKGWLLKIVYTDDLQKRPRRIEMTHPDGYQAILLVKNREVLQTPFTLENMKLNIPDGTITEPLSKYAPPKP